MTPPCPPRDLLEENAYLRWLCSNDTGASSENILFQLTGMQTGSAEHWGGHKYSYPHDSGDFGRCYRLVERFPHFREHLEAFATAQPELTRLSYPDQSLKYRPWLLIVARWDELATVEGYDAFQKAAGLP